MYKWPGFTTFVHESKFISRKNRLRKTQLFYECCFAGKISKNILYVALDERNETR